MLDSRAGSLPIGRWVFWAVAVVPSLAEGEPPISFNRDVLPILAANCLSCHGFDAHGRQAGLRLDTAEGATATLDSGERAVVPGDAAASELLRRIDSADADELMPPPETGHRLSAAERRVLRDWIAAGAAYEPHWAFLPPGDVQPPGSPARHPIDRFVLAGLEGIGLEPAAPAPPETLLRRVHLDLTGLPPTPAEIDGFLVAHRADPEAAYAAVVDRLLASPHYGERQARWWLDMARYADSNGYSVDAPREIWRWRDWVIDAFNRDLPFDQFTIEQLAGDLLPAATQEQRIATGFHRNTQINEEGGIDPEQFRIESVFDRVATTGVVWLGLSIGCAQCHDHKFDPVSQRDYYRLFAFLNDQSEPKLKVTAAGVDPVAVKADRDAALAAVNAHVAARAAELEAWEAGLPDDVRKRLPKPAADALGLPAAKRSADHRRLLFAAGPGAQAEDFEALHERFQELDEQLNSGPTTLVLAELPKPRRTTVFIQGDFTRPADEVSPGTPEALPPLAATDRRPTRLDLARWLVSPANPLTARVLANRIWQQHFGRGLVETDNDFGLMGSQPSHPELLDWLARELVRGGWSIKSLHRLIVTSQTYRQSSVETKAQVELDPQNVFLARQRRLRLDAELVRDVALVASGRLAPRLGGPPVFPPIPDGATAVGQVKRAWKTSAGDDRHRRGLYTFVYRASPPPALVVFDAPEGFTACTRRNRSNTPLQALTLLNDPAFVELADALAEVVAKEGVAAAFRRCTGRRPDAAELAVLEPLAPRAKRVIYLFMAGGPSQLDLFDHKPELTKRNGQPIPSSFIEGKRFAFMDSSHRVDLLGTKRAFAQHGESGAWVSDLLPHVGGIADKLCIVKSCTTELFNHAPAKLFMNTGTGQFGRPSMGAGIADRREATYARNCLLARRLVERGVRFVQLYHTNWDHHGGTTENLEKHLPEVCGQIDRATAALVMDLERRGLLDDTIVVWGGEFGRTPMGEKRESTGRNHHIDAFTTWFAGGGFRPGLVFGETDEFGFAPVSHPVPVRDLHATLLHQLGLDHARLSVRVQGLDYKLTGVKPARVVSEIVV